jgi:hypothetical protein
LLARLDEEVEVLLDREGTSVHHALCAGAVTELGAVPGSLQVLEMRSWGNRVCCWSKSAPSAGNPSLRDQLGPLAPLLDAAQALAAAEVAGLVRTHLHAYAQDSLEELLEREPGAAPWVAHARVVLTEAAAAREAWVRDHGLDALRIAAAAESTSSEATWLVRAGVPEGRFVLRPMTLQEVEDLDPSGAEVDYMLTAEEVPALQDSVLAAHRDQPEVGTVMVVLKERCNELLINDLLEAALAGFKVSTDGLTTYLLPASLASLASGVRLQVAVPVPEDALLEPAVLETAAVLAAGGADPLTVFEAAQAL